MSDMAPNTGAKEDADTLLDTTVINYRPGCQSCSNVHVCCSAIIIIHKIMLIYTVVCKIIHTTWKIRLFCRFINYKTFYVENFFELLSFVYMLLCINPHISWLNLICIIIDMTQRSTLHMFRIIHSRDDISQKCHFMRRVNIIPQLRQY